MYDLSALIDHSDEKEETKVDQKEQVEETQKEEIYSTKQKTKSR